MRSLDPLQQQAHQQHMGAALPPPVAQMAPYYHNAQTLPHPQHQYPNVTSDPSGQNMRYALPAPDNRVMSGGRHKKVVDGHLNYAFYADNYRLTGNQTQNKDRLLDL
jgi:hypothetical protein